MNLDYGALIKQCREEFGLTQQDLADRVGVHRVTIIQAERDADCIKFGTMQKILYELFLQIDIQKWKP